MTEAWWLSLLNGSVGALLGALVAVVVLSRSIKVQRKLFFIGQGDLYEQAVVQERKRDEQLAADRMFAILEARKSREVAAMGDFIAAAEALRKEFINGPPEIKARLFTMQGAAHRWRLEVTSKPLYDEIGRWPDFIGFLAFEAYQKEQPLIAELKADKKAAAERLGSAFTMPLSELYSELNSDHGSPTERLMQQAEAMRTAIGSDVIESLNRLTRGVSALRRFSRLYVLGFPNNEGLYLETIKALRLDIGNRTPVPPVNPEPPETPRHTRADPSQRAG